MRYQFIRNTGSIPTHHVVHLARAQRLPCLAGAAPSKRSQENAQLLKRSEIHQESYQAYGARGCTPSCAGGGGTAAGTAWLG